MSEAQGALVSLLAACGRGENSAFDELYGLAAAKLFSVCLRILRRRDWAEEVLQEAFVRIWRHAASYSPDRGQAMTWMISITRNAAINRLRQQRTDPLAASEGDLEGHLAATLADPADRTQQREAASAISVCLEKLRLAERKAVLMAYCLGYNHSELVDQLDAPLGTVKSWIRRGLAKLKTCLEA
ncbi:MAG: sigma-70 family RNA polymerase sigma factor [Alphaproteobacteria bacterium]